jgi:hypothetical protein
MFILARVIEQIWENIRENKTDRDTQVEAQWKSDDEVENGMGLFSPEHLKYVVARGLEDRNADLTAQNRPVAWWTTRSRHHEAGHLYAFKLRLRRNHIPPEVEGQDEMAFGNMLEEISPLCTDVIDDFWNAMKTVGYNHIRFDYLILFRLLFHHISVTCQSHQIIITPNEMKNLMVNFKIGATDMTSFWDDHKKCLNHIKNHHQEKNGWTISEFRYFREHFRTDTPGEEKDSAAMAMKGVQLNVLIQMYEESPDAPTSIEIPFLTDSIIPNNLRQEHIQKLNQDGNGFANFAKTITHSCRHGIISMSLLQKLLEFRLQWNINRRQYAEERKNGIPSEECITANIRLLESAGFKGGVASGFRIKPSAVRRKRRRVA